jgi:hypothetical protein
MQGFGIGVGATCGEADGTALRAMCGHDEHDQAESASKQAERILHVVRFIQAFNK